MYIHIEIKSKHIVIISKLCIFEYLTMRRKKPVWILFRMIELLLTIASCWSHLSCIRSHISRHIFILCATYGGGLIFAALGLLTLYMANRVSLRNEAICSGIFGLFCLFAIYMNMHLGSRYMIRPFIMPTEVYQYAVLRCCKINSQLSLCSASVYLLHCSLAIDMLLTHPLEAVGGNAPPLEPRGNDRPLQLYFISKTVETYLKTHYLFQLLTGNAADKYPSNQRSFSSNINETYI